MTTSPKLQRAPAAGNGAELLASLDAPNRRKVAGVLLALAADLLADDEPEPAPGEWLTLDAARVELGVKASKGPDPNRAIKDRLRALGVEVAKVGHALLVRRASLAAAIDAQARPLRPAAPRPGPASTSSASTEDAEAAALAAAGLRRVEPRAAGGRR